MEKTTILLSRKTRELLAEVGKKNQTYDEVIRNLIDSKKKFDSLDYGLNARLSSESFGSA